MSTNLETITQKKLDSLSAKHLHVRRRTVLNRGIQLVDFLALAVPVLYFAFRLLTKGTKFEGVAEGSWEVLASVLLVLTILKIVYRWQDKAEIHSRLLGENIALVGLADDLLSRPDTLSSENIQLFSLLVQKSEREDRETLGQPEEKDRQFAYRQALMELEPRNVHVVCPICKSSPYRFTPGSCQVCGNTPAQ